MENVTETPLENELQSSYIDYAMSVIIGRAIPDARDGLKPVQRRILYAMYNMNNLHNQPTKKSARIVGECFIKDTLVLTDRGLIPIQNIEKGNKVYTQSGSHKVSQCYIMPKRRLIKIRLENGTENIVTDSQQLKILTKDWKISWKEAKRLEIGDYLVTKSFYPEITEEVSLGERKLNENIAYLLGQLLSDGFVLHDTERGKYHRIGFCSSSLDVINAISLCLKQEFNYLPTVEEKTLEHLSANGMVLLSKFYQLRVNSGVINKFFIETFDLLGCKAWSKRIPTQILRSSKKIIFSFLSGLIDGDGHVHNQRTLIQYTTTSKEMANQLMILLHHLGIHGKKYEIKRNEAEYILGRKVQHGHDHFSLEFSGVNAQHLAANLNLKKEEKKKRTAELINHPLKMVDFDILPWASKKIFTELSNCHLGDGWYQDVNGMKFRDGIKYKNKTKIRYCSDLHDLPLHISQIIEWGIQDKLNKINPPFAQFINAVIHDSIYFSSVVAIEDGEEDITYDVQVEDCHEFIANGMIAHNCLGKFHPHGDIAIYDALARMAQDFTMNHTFVEGQGNFGSVDGDPPAAMRYTEVRLTKIAEEMLADLDKETVQMIPNFDNTEKEPNVLPAKVPNLLINGTSGIAVGVATSIPPHNLNEVCDAIVYLLAHREATVQEILGIIKGPDFPTGGYALISENSYNGYRYGKGQVTIRANTEIDTKSNQIIVNEIPYNVNKSALIQNIANLTKEKKIVGITDIRDESDKSGIRIVIELREDVSADVVLNSLFKHTQLETTFPIINLAIIGNKLKSFNLLELLTTFLDHRREIIRNRSRFELNTAKDRAHIVEGLITAIDNIDSVVKDIRASRELMEARTKLMNNYSLTEKQANAILEMRLSKLTNLEFTSLNDERAELEKRIKYYSNVLANPQEVDNIIKNETLEMKKEYGKPRKTLLIQSDESAEITQEDLIHNESVTVIFTDAGYVKRMSIGTYKEQARGGKGVIAISLKEGDYVKQIIPCFTKDYLLCISDKGRAYWLKAYMVPESGRYAEGKAIVNLLNLQGESIVTILNVNDFVDSKLIFLTTKGLVKKTYAKLFAKPRSNGVKAISLNADDSIADVQLYKGEKCVVITTKRGKAIKFDEVGIRFLGRVAMGVRGIKLGSGDTAKNIIPVEGQGHLLTVTEHGYGKLTDINKYRTQNRSGSGVINIKVTQKTGEVAKSMFVTTRSNVLLISSRGVTIKFQADSIRITGRSASGVRLMKLEPGARVVDAKLIEEV